MEISAQWICELKPKLKRTHTNSSYFLFINFRELQTICFSRTFVFGNQAKHRIRYQVSGKALHRTHQFFRITPKKLPGAHVVLGKWQKNS